MGVQIAEMAGGLVSLAIQGVIFWVALELGAKIFFWVRERAGE